MRGDNAEYRTYETNGDELTVIEVYDYGADGNINAMRKYIYDGAGNELYRERFNSGGGTLDISETVYNEAGLKIRFATDYDGDGIWDEELSYTYDDLGNLEWEVGLETTHHYINTYDGELLISTEYDLNNDEVIDEIHQFTYDDQGRLLEERSDDIINRYNTSGVLIYEEYITYYEGTDDTELTKKVYDDDGRILRYLLYKSWYGTTSLTAYTYDTKGNLLQKVTCSASGDCLESSEVCCTSATPTIRYYSYDCFQK